MKDGILTTGRCSQYLLLTMSIVLICIACHHHVLAYYYDQY